jgi:hypothetical protein
MARRSTKKDAQGRTVTNDEHEALVLEPGTPRTKAEKTPVPCGCGCGNPGAGRFRPGHDARLHGRYKRHTEGRMPRSEWDALSPHEQAAVLEFGGALGGSFARECSRPAPKGKEQVTRERLAKRIERLEKELAEAKKELASIA